MVQFDDIAPEEQRLIYVGFISGLCFVLILIYVVLQCICCKKKAPALPTNGSVVGPNHKHVQTRPLVRANNNHEGCYEVAYANSDRFMNSRAAGPQNYNRNNGNKFAKHHRLQNGPSANNAAHALRRALPAPPSNLANSSSNVNNNSTYSESLTRESSTSELYASVDKNPSTNDNSTVNSHNASASVATSLKSFDLQQQQQRREPSAVTSSSMASRHQSHFYAKICDDHHVYSKIWLSAAPGNNNSGDTYDNVNIADDSDFDPFYSRVHEGNSGAVAGALNDNSSATHQRLPPLKNIVCHHAYEYPQFTPKQNCNNNNTNNNTNNNDNVSPLIMDGKESIVTDPFYSKIGSEDPYSSIKSEEHYSRVDREDSLSMNDDERNDDDGDVTDAATSAKKRLKNNNNQQNYEDDDDYFRYSRPGPSSGRPPIARRFSDGDEYTIVRKGSTGVYRIPARLLPPPIPDKRFSRGDVAGEQQPEESVDEPLRKEPNYRYITVRESLDVLRERMEQQHRPLASNFVAVSDPSLHYYSTISEHSYEVVPSRIVHERNVPANNSVFDDTPLYIDQDDVRSMINEVPPAATNVSRAQHDLNSTMHSDEMTIRGSHVTLVQVEAILTSDRPTTSSSILESSPPNTNSDCITPPSVRSPLSTANKNKNNNNNDRNAVYSNYETIDSNILDDRFAAPGANSSLESNKIPQYPRYGFNDHHHSLPPPNRRVSPLESGNKKLETELTSKNPSTSAESTRSCPHNKKNTCETNNIHSDSAPADPEYPTTFCFCHAPKQTKKMPSSNEKPTNSSKGRTRNNKRDRDNHF